MDISKVDAVITDLDIKLDPYNSNYGRWVNYRFIDTYPYFSKLNQILEEVRNRRDVELVDFEYSFTGIHEDTLLKSFDIVRH